MPTETVICWPETHPLPALAGDHCPSEIAAVRKLVASIGKPIARIYLQPGFFCGGLWPPVGPPPVCFGVLEQPGSTMHGWVSFSGTAKVAAVTLLWLVFPVSGPIPSPVPAWTAKLDALMVPPSGWSMPTPPPPVPGMVNLPDPSAGLTKDQAVAAAQVAAPQQAAADVLEADLGRFVDLRNAYSPSRLLLSPAPDELVWRIDLGTVRGPLDADGTVVIVDYRDGRVIQVWDWVS